MKIGIKGKLYYDTAVRATWGSLSGQVHQGVAPATLTEIDQVKDVVLDLAVGEAEATTRAGNGWEQFLAGLTSASIEIELTFDPSSTIWQAFRDAFLGRTSIALAILDGDKATTGTEGLWADFTVLKFATPQNAPDKMKTAISLKPSPLASDGTASVPPEHVEVTAT